MTYSPFDNTPKSDRLREVLRQSILDGFWQAEDRLPSEPELSARYGVSRSTVREAITALVQEGSLLRVHGKGTFVAAGRPDHRTFAFLLPFLFFSDSRSAQPFGAGTDVFPRLMQAIEGEARRAKANVLLYLNNRLPTLERENLENVLQRRVDGILLNYIGDACNRDALEQLREAGIPLVLIDRYFDDLPLDFVVTDNERGAYRATQLLAAQGFERIIHITSPGEYSSLRDRRRGYERAMQEMGSPSQIMVVADREPDNTGMDRVSEEERAYQLAQTFLKTAKLPLALFATEAPIMAGLWRAFRESGLPHDQVAFACFDEPFIDFPSTVFSLKIIQSFRELGQRSIVILEERIARSGPPEPYRLFIEPEIVASKV